MGLDQFARFVKPEEDVDAVDDAFYWRKHNRLQGWMENLFHTKGGTGEFNVIPLELTLEDLDCLEMDIESEGLPETEGFFFGGDSYEDYKGEYGYYEKDKEFITEARKAINDGKRVIYSCWY